MVVSDHGGIFYAHGGNSYEELTTPIIYSGKGIKKGHPIKQQIYKYDVAADVAFALGLKIPQQWLGRPVRAAFKGFDEPGNIFAHNQSGILDVYYGVQGMTDKLLPGNMLFRTKP